MIRAISIKNFRGIKNLDGLKLGLGPTFIIGQNGTGKSTFISAIYLTQQLIKRRSADFVLTRVAPFGKELLSHGQRGASSEFSFCLKGERGSYRFSYSIAVHDEGFTIPSERLEEIDNQYETKTLVYERLDDGIKIQDGTKIPLHVSRDELVISGYNEDRTRDAATMLSNFKVLWLNGENNSEFRFYRKDGLNSSNLDAMAVKLYNTDRKSFNSAVAVIQTLIPSFLPPEIREISPHKSTLDQEDTRYVVFWHEEWNDGSTLEYTLPSLSDGNIRIIQLIFSIFTSKSLTCIIGEEIENGQHFGRIKTLLEVVKTMSIKRNLQMIFTTHSTELLSGVAPSDVVYVDKDESGFSRFQNLNEKVDVPYIQEVLGHEPTSKELLDMGMV